MTTRLRRSGLSKPELTLPLAAVVTGIGSLVLPWTTTTDLGNKTLLALGFSDPLLTTIAVVGAVLALASVALSSKTNLITGAIVISAVSALAAVSAWGLTPLETPADGAEVRRHVGSYLLIFSAGLSLAGAVSQRTRRATAAVSDDADPPPSA